MMDHMKRTTIVLLTIVLLIMTTGCRQSSPEDTFEYEETGFQTIAWQSTIFIAETVSVSQERIYLDPLQAQIHEYLASVEVDLENIAYMITNYETGETWVHNESVPFQSGSVYKLPLAMLYYDGINQGYIDPSKELEYAEWIKETGGVISENYEYEDTLPLWEVLDYVILYSDNVAGHMLYSNYGGWSYMRGEATRYSQYKDEELYYELGSYFTARYLNDVLAHLYNNQSAYSRLIWQLGVAAPETYLNSASYGLTHQKIGNVAYLYNAAGIVFAEHPYSIVVMTAFGEFGHEVMGEMNRIVYDYLNPVTAQ